MRQAILTRYYGPTNTQPSRIKAFASAGSILVPWDYEFSVEENHSRAAQALADKLGWGGEWYAGGLPDDDGNVFVNIGEKALGRDKPAFTRAQVYGGVR